MTRWQRICSTIFVCLGLAWLSPARVLAQGSPKLIDEATAAFVALNFEGSLQKLDAALKVKGNPQALLVRIYGLRALCYLSLSKSSEAELAFTAALSLDPGFRLGPEVSPRFSEPFKILLQRSVPELKIEVVVPAEATAGESVSVSVKLVSDPANLSDSLMFYYRRASMPEYTSERIRLIRGLQNRYSLPASFTGVGGVEPVEWYYEVLDRHGGKLRSLEKSDPRRLLVRPREKPIALVPGPPAPAEVSQPSWYERWWVWAIIGSVAAAGTAAAILAGSQGEAASHRDFSIDIR